MSASRKIIAVQFVEWMHKHRYAKYWGSDKPNCEKWYVMNTMPDRKYYTLEELYDIFEREQNDYKQQSNCNKPAVMLALPDVRNKLSPITNLIAMLEDSELLYHHDVEMHKIIEKEIEQRKKKHCIFIRQ